MDSVRDGRKRVRLFSKAPNYWCCNLFPLCDDEQGIHETDQSDMVSDIPGREGKLLERVSGGKPSGRPHGKAPQDKKNLVGNQTLLRKSNNIKEIKHEKLPHLRECLLGTSR